MGSCREERFRTEETVLQPMAKWVREQRQSCKNAPCVWWLLCLNKLVCAIFWVVLQVAIWVSIVLVRVITVITCPIIKLVIGLVTLNTQILGEAFEGLWEAVKFVFYTAIGLVAAWVVTLAGIIQTAIGVQRSRPLTTSEWETLKAIYWDALNYDAIRIVDRAGILAGLGGRPYTIGFTIYANGGLLAQTLVHESVHIWQFQYEGTKYIGQSLLLQLDEMLSPGYNSYNWQAVIPPGPNGWYLIKSAEAQAKFVDRVYELGVFLAPDGRVLHPAPAGFFYVGRDPGQNQFIDNGDFTEAANAAWRILRTG